LLNICLDMQILAKRNEEGQIVSQGWVDSAQ